MVAAKAAHVAEVSEKLATRDGERYHYRLAETRCRQVEDTEKLFDIIDDSAHLLIFCKKAVNQCYVNFMEIPKIVEFPVILFLLHDLFTARSVDQSERN